uniref:NADH:ubiquinone reductase (H(+)-translocating) n=1 Tax=Igernella notabilis TaxID=479643 RepID=I6LIR7_9METZ|nr:NADH dehydrogenase subunit 2 [Igernella notabilis]ABW83948.1 NADH dehydrogenase subunit 2 [Igernella notabilis]
MEEYIKIIVSPEGLLSLTILYLIIHGIQYFTLKLSMGVVIIMIVLQFYNKSDYSQFYEITNGFLVSNNWIMVSKIIIIFGGLLILLINKNGEKEKSSNIVPVLILVVILSSIFLVSSENWLTVYLSIELLTLSLLILITIKQNSVLGAEAGIKYFVLGAVSSGLFLFGCVLIYGLTSEISIQGGELTKINENAGKTLITISLLFKLSVAPFHMWAPDVYEGSPTAVTALVATVPKIGMFSILAQIGPIYNILIICAGLSMIVGAIGGLNQTKIKRLLAYSGIGHMGFIVFGVGNGCLEGYQASLVYIIIYTIMVICSFSIILSLNLKKNLLSELSNVSRLNPVIGGTLSLVFLSMAGVPPLIGFLNKWLIIQAGIINQYYLMSIIAVVSSVVAGINYVRVVKIIYFQIDSALFIWNKVLNINNIYVKNGTLNLKRAIIIGGSFYVVLFLMICPNILLRLTHGLFI